MGKKYDLVIIGAGPAGLTAAVYAARYKLDTVVIGNLAGGLATEAHKICNFPTYKEIPGAELVNKMAEQAKELGVNIINEQVKQVEKKKDFTVKTDKKRYTAKKVLIATGGEKRKLKLKNEEKFIGKGVSYCATCDAALYRDKVVAVLGGGNSALMAAELLAKYAKKVYVIYRRDKFFRAEPMRVEQVRKDDKIETVFGANVTELVGKDKLEKVKLDNGKSIAVDGLFVEFGAIPQIKLVKPLKLETTERGYIKVDKQQRTSVKGLFAAGDVTDTPLKQVITACADGAIAAATAFREPEDGQ